MSQSPPSDDASDPPTPQPQQTAPETSESTAGVIRNHIFTARNSLNRAFDLSEKRPEDEEPTLKLENPNTFKNAYEALKKWLPKLQDEYVKKLGISAEKAALEAKEVRDLAQEACEILEGTWVQAKDRTEEDERTHMPEGKDPKEVLLDIEERIWFLVSEIGRRCELSDMDWELDMSL